MPPPRRLGGALDSFDDDVDNDGKPDSRLDILIHALKGLFKHLFMLILVSLYSIGGAALYMQIEGSNEEAMRDDKRKYTTQVLEAKDAISNQMYRLSLATDDKQLFDKMAARYTIQFHDFVTRVSRDSSLQYDGDPGTWEYSWTFTKSLLLTVTSIASIGYGHIAPVTFSGRIFTILYNVIGIPLFLVFLANIGNVMATALIYIYSRLCCRWCRIRRRKCELPPGNDLEKRILWKENIGAETYMPSDEVDVPITVVLSVLCAYLILGGALFSSWEGWPMHSGAYFTLITLATIGLGDYVPGNSLLGTEGSSNHWKMVATIAFIVIGMALLSMCVSVMQIQVAKKVKWVMKEVGLAEDPVDRRIKYKIKTSDPNTVMETPNYG